MLRGFEMRRAFTILIGTLLLVASAVPAAAQSPTEELLSGMVTEEVEPGVYRVIGDGDIELEHLFHQQSRPYHLVSGADGGIWLVTVGGYQRLGGDTEGVWPDEVEYVNDFAVAPDGTIWAAWGEGSDGQTDTTIYSHPGSNTTVPERATDMGWERHSEGDLVKVFPDSRVWAANGGQLGKLGPVGWQPAIEGFEWPYFSRLLVSDDGDIWAFGLTPPPLRFIDGAWREAAMAELHIGSPVEVGPDGTVWGISGDEDDIADRVIRFDGSEWREWEPPDWLSPDRHLWRWDGNEWVEATESDADENLGVEGVPGILQVASDGSAWVGTRLGMWGDQPVCTDELSGVARFDGRSWSRFLLDQCIESMDIAADGSVWLLATESDAVYPLIRTYVITPEAVATAE